MDSTYTYDYTESQLPRGNSNLSTILRIGFTSRLSAKIIGTRGRGKNKLRLDADASLLVLTNHTLIRSTSFFI